ncbi:MAG: hypothetical protein EHM21_17855 [Chloroflexi bacterium]|nr:MAG: hypothetical protein EHM21_17855 [Chloroflexota bacterium]
MKIVLSRTYLPATLWGGACIGLVLVIGGLELDWGRQLHSPLPVLRKPVAKLAETPLLPEFALPSLEQGYPETVNRPLFVVTRRPAPPPPPPTPPKPVMQKGQFILHGVTIAGDVSIALLKEKNGTKTHRVKKGAEINGIRLEKVEAEKVTLTQWDDREELILKIQPMPKPAPAPAPARPGQPGQAGQPAVDGVPAPTPATGATAGTKNPNDLINRRRALRGLPPI